MRRYSEALRLVENASSEAFAVASAAKRDARHQNLSFAFLLNSEMQNAPPFTNAAAAHMIDDTKG